MKTLLVFLFMIVVGCSMGVDVSDSNHVIEHRFGFDLDALEQLCEGKFPESQYVNEDERADLIYQCQVEYLDNLMTLLQQTQGE